MVLVEYSESDGSDAETNQKTHPAAKEQLTSQKPTFQKVVDRSNPHKIRVNLPGSSNPTPADGDDVVEPAPKRVKVGLNAFSGFNSLLPAPKKIAGSSAGNGNRRGGLGSGVNLKTGATPGFSREVIPSVDEVDCEDQENENETIQTSSETNGFTHNDTKYNQESKLSAIVKAEPKKHGSAMIFKPLSVTRKPKKKQPTIPAGQNRNVSQGSESSQHAKPIPKLSLFAVDYVQETQPASTSVKGEYQPMIYQASDSISEPPQSNSYEERNQNDLGQSNQSGLTPSITLINQYPQSLDTIATDLNLSASAKRQLLGRQKNNPSAINIVNFNTDQEYVANEILRQAGDQVQHNPIRAIAPGKHSLKQLVNAASNQKDALEEQFASGRRNKKEAGSKYGW